MKGFYRLWLPASFLKRLKLTTNVGYWQRGSDYQTKSNYWQVMFKPEYKLKEWFLLGLGYYFDNKSSKSQESDYRNNRIEISVVSEFLIYEIIFVNNFFCLCFYHFTAK